jgi:hypothetical protein
MAASEGKPVEVDVPRVVTALDLLGRVDYRDAYAIETAVERTPEEWMRAFLQGAPRWFTLPWMIGLGAGLLGIDPRVVRRPGHVMGWAVLRDEPDVFVVGLDSPRGFRARLAAVPTPGRVTIATEIGLDTAYARRLWPAIRRGHRYFAPYLLGLAARRVRAAEGRSARPTEIGSRSAAAGVGQAGRP